MTTETLLYVLAGLAVLVWLLYKALVAWAEHTQEQRKRREQAMKEVILARAVGLPRRDLYKYACEVDHRELSREGEIRERVRRELQAIDLQSLEHFYPSQLQSVVLSAVQDVEILKIVKQLIARHGWAALELKRMTQQAQLAKIKKLLELPPPEEKQVEVIDPEEQLRAKVEESVGRRLKWEIYAQMTRSEATEQLLKEMRKREQEIDKLPLSDEDKLELKNRLLKDFEYTLRKIQGGI